MMTRGDGETGAGGFAGAEACICVTLPAGGAAIDDALLTSDAGGVTRGGIGAGGGATLAVGVAAGVLTLGGVGGTFGGITTTDGGRCAAATEAGVTIRGAGVGASGAGFGGTAFGITGAAGASVFASTGGGGTGGLIAGRAGGCSTASFCCVMARSTSPGREICERSILVLISSSP